MRDFLRELMPFFCANFSHVVATRGLGAGFSRGSLGPVAQHALLVVQRSQASRWAARPPCAHAIDASGGSPEDASADEYSMPVS